MGSRHDGARMMQVRAIATLVGAIVLSGCGTRVESPDSLAAASPDRQLASAPNGAAGGAAINPNASDHPSALGADTPVGGANPGRPVASSSSGASPQTVVKSGAGQTQGTNAPVAAGVQRGETPAKGGGPVNPTVPGAPAPAAPLPSSGR